MDGKRLGWRKGSLEEDQDRERWGSRKLNGLC